MSEMATFLGYIVVGIAFAVVMAYVGVDYDDTPFPLMAAIFWPIGIPVTCGVFLVKHAALLGEKHRERRGERQREERIAAIAAEREIERLLRESR